MLPTEFMDKPGGRPVALAVTLSPSLSPALIGRITLSPSAFSCGPGLTTKTCVTVQSKVWLAVFVPSEAVSVTVYGLPASAVAPMVPVIVPLEGSMLRPAGRSEAEKVSASPSASEPPVGT